MYIKCVTIVIVVNYLCGARAIDVAPRSLIVSREVGWRGEVTFTRFRRTYYLNQREGNGFECYILCTWIINEVIFGETFGSSHLLTVTVACEVEEELLRWRLLPLILLISSFFFPPFNRALACWAFYCVTLSITIYNNSGEFNASHPRTRVCVCVCVVKFG